MPVLQAIVLGVVQGLSEFLPISSSGHLRIVRWLLGWHELAGRSAAAFDVAVHIGTLAGALAYLRRDVVRYASAAAAPLCGRGPLGRDGRVGWALAASAVPAGVVGLAFGDMLAGSDRIAVTAVCLAGFGVLMGWADLSAGRRGRGRRAVRDDERRERVLEDLGLGTALLLGAAQALALQPGVSRSGVTVTAARLMGFSREQAVRLVFLMSLPVIAGAGVYGMIDLSVPPSLWPAMAWGAAAAAVTGRAAVSITVRVASRAGLMPFAVYRMAVGVAVLGILASSWR